MSSGDPSAVPPWPYFLRPILVVLSDGAVWTSRSIEPAILQLTEATDEQRAELLASGQSRIRNRIGWATSFLVRAQAIAKPGRARFVITQAGHDLLAANPDGISEATLKTIPAFNDYLPVRGAAEAAAIDKAAAAEEDPIEQIEAGVARFEADVASELLRRLREQTPAFFEQAVVDLLIAMGYGSADDKRVRRLGGSRDGGVDGVIDQDALGLSRVYVQAKRYGATSSVQRPELQGFVGALADNGELLRIAGGRRF